MKLDFFEIIFSNVSMPRYPATVTPKQNSYVRKAYIRSDGTFVSATRVSYPFGVKSKSKIRIPLKKGELTKFGYHLDSPAKIRRKALIDALASGMTYSSVVRKLNALRVMNKFHHPKSSEKYYSDITWLQSFH